AEGAPPVECGPIERARRSSADGVEHARVGPGRFVDGGRRIRCDWSARGDDVRNVGIGDVVDAGWRRDERRGIRFAFGLRPARWVAVTEGVPGASRRGPQTEEREYGGSCAALHRGELTDRTSIIVTVRRMSAPKSGVRTGTCAEMRTLGRSERAQVRVS